MADAKLGDEFPGCTIDDIKQVELMERRTRLGKSFYDFLIGSLVTHEADPYQSKTYSVGDKVVYNGLIYEATAETDYEPTHTADWKQADKFDDDDLNTFWYEVLRRYLSMRVIQNTVPRMETQMTASGTVQLNGETFKAAGTDPVKRLQNWVNTQLKISWANVEYHLEENKAKDVFKKYFEFIESDTCETSSGTDLYAEPSEDADKTSKKKESVDLNGYSFY